jgi:hypothetical protein
MTKIREEQELSGLTRGEYITQILTNYYEKGGKEMEFTKTLAFQVPEALYNRIKDHLEREKQRTGKRLSQKDFVIGLIEQALAEAEQRDTMEAMEAEVGGDADAG